MGYSRRGILPIVLALLAWTASGCANLAATLEAIPRSTPGAAAALFMRNDRLRDRALGVQGLLTLGSLAYLLFASSPFTRLTDPPLDGGGGNPQ